MSKSKCIEHKKLFNKNFIFLSFDQNSKNILFHLFFFYSFYEKSILPTDYFLSLFGKSL